MNIFERLKQYITSVQDSLVYITSLHPWFNFILAVTIWSRDKSIIMSILQMAESRAGELRCLVRGQPAIKCPGEGLECRRPSIYIFFFLVIKNDVTESSSIFKSWIWFPSSQLKPLSNASLCWRLSFKG